MYAIGFKSGTFLNSHADAYHNHPIGGWGVLFGGGSGEVETKSVHIASLECHFSSVHDIIHT